jgi:hypothetical protein
MISTIFLTVSIFACDLTLPEGSQNYSIEDSSYGISKKVCHKMRLDLNKSISSFKRSNSRQQQNQFLYKHGSTTVSLQIQQVKLGDDLRGQILIDM